MSTPRARVENAITKIIDNSNRLDQVLEGPADGTVDLTSTLNVKTQANAVSGVNNTTTHLLKTLSNLNPQNNFPIASRQFYRNIFGQNVLARGFIANTGDSGFRGISDLGSRFSRLPWNQAGEGGGAFDESRSFATGEVQRIYGDSDLIRFGDSTQTTPDEDFASKISSEFGKFFYGIFLSRVLGGGTPRTATLYLVYTISTGPGSNDWEFAEPVRLHNTFPTFQGQIPYPVRNPNALGSTFGPNQSLLLHSQSNSTDSHVYTSVLISGWE